MKKIFIALVSLLLITAQQSVAYQKPATLVIMDTAINYKLSVFKNNLIKEVCILEWNSCPNRSGYMEGKKSAFIPVNIMSINGFNHGNKMAHASIITNPNIKIIFIRIIGANKDGSRQPTTEMSLINAFNWVLLNKDKYNIAAVAMSQGHTRYRYSDQYCPDTPKTKMAISSLSKSGIPLFLPSGNESDLTKVMWPACLNEGIVVSASTEDNKVSMYTNYDKNVTDIFALGSLELMDVNGITFFEQGTSISTQVAASIYVGIKNKYPTYNMNDIINLMLENSSQAKDININALILNKDILNKI